MNFPGRLCYWALAEGLISLGKACDQNRSHKD